MGSVGGFHERRMDLLKGFFSWFGDKIQWARNLWSGVKEFFNGADSDDEAGDSQSVKPKGSGRATGAGTERRPANNTGNPAKSTNTEANRKATNAFISGGRPVSTRTAAQKPISQTTNNKSINVKQEISSSTHSKSRKELLLTV